MPSLNFTPQITFGKRLVPSRRRQERCAASSNLNTMAMAVAFDRQFLVARKRDFAASADGLLVRRFEFCVQELQVVSSAPVHPRTGAFSIARSALPRGGGIGALWNIYEALDDRFDPLIDDDGGGETLRFDVV